MNDLLIEQNKYRDAILTDRQQGKIVGDPVAGAKIEIFWAGRDEVDSGYLFALPSSQDEYDLLFHVPSPDNSEGIGDAPPVWGHLNALCKNAKVKRIVVSR